MLKYLKREEDNLSEHAVENGTQDSGCGLALREVSQSTSVHCEYNNAPLDTSDEVPYKTARFC
jgi:hypothetical protein